MKSYAYLYWGMLFGAIGMGYFAYGKKQKKLVPLVSGLVLCAFPYFVSNTVLILLIGCAFAAAPFVLRY